MPLALSKDISAAEAHLYLREGPMRQSFEMFLLAWRTLNEACTSVLDEHELGQAHHRILFFVSSYENITPSILLKRLGITKQSLGRALSDLKEHGFLEQYQDTQDRRLKPIRLTQKGREVEAQIFNCVRQVMTQAYRRSDGGQVEGFRGVLRSMLSSEELP